MFIGKDIIVFSDQWGRHPSSCQHIVKQLLANNRVFWINTIGMRSPGFSMYDIKRSIEVMLGWFFYSHDTKGDFLKNLVVFSLVAIPFNQFSIVRFLNKLIFKYTIYSKIYKEKSNKYIIITTFPTTCDYIQFFADDIIVYYCVDDFVNWPGVDLDLVSRMEDELIRKSNFVFATSEYLCESKIRGSKKPLLLAHGVDFEHFHSVLSIADGSSQLKGYTKPIIGFFGAVSAWVDFELILFLARQRPLWSFVFIGPIDTDVSTFSTVKNVFILGKIPYEQLPSYASCFDAGIIPFKINELTIAVNPLKLLEYLSMGVPVISSFMPEVLKFSDFVSVCFDYKDFLLSIDNALESDCSDLRIKRINFSRNHSWSSVAEKFCNLIVEG